MEQLRAALYPGEEVGLWRLWHGVACHLSCHRCLDVHLEKGLEVHGACHYGLLPRVSGGIFEDFSAPNTFPKVLLTVFLA